MTHDQATAPAFCQYCGAARAPGAAFCTACGSALDAAAPAPPRRAIETAAAAANAAAALLLFVAYWAPLYSAFAAPRPYQHAFYSVFFLVLIELFAAAAALGVTRRLRPWGQALSIGAAASSVYLALEFLYVVTHEGAYPRFGTHLLVLAFVVAAAAAAVSVVALLTGPLPAARPRNWVGVGLALAGILVFAVGAAMEWAERRPSLLDQLWGPGRYAVLLIGALGVAALVVVLQGRPFALGVLAGWFAGWAAQAHSYGVLDHLRSGAYVWFSGLAVVAVAMVLWVLSLRRTATVVAPSHEGPVEA